VFVPPTRPKSAFSSALRAFGAVLLMLPALSAEAAPKPKADGPSKRPAATTGSAADRSSPLDTATVRRYYLDGDFEPAIDLLETTLNYKTGFSHEDSVFIFKHLGVMYAAKDATREKGKKYMLRLLEVEPTARIMDMYASDMIYMIFRNIQDEFEMARRRLAKADTGLGGGHGTPVNGRPEAAKAKPAKPGPSRAIWVGAGATVAAAAGVATWYYFSDEPKTTVRNHEPD
jgi:hypothetical protein